MNDKRALVTGAGSGIGRAIVRRLAADGYDVVAVGRRLAALEETAVEVGGASRTQLIAADVRDREELGRALAGVGPFSVLVANAGVCARTWLDGPDSDAVWDEVIGTNLHGVWNTFRAVGARLAPGSAAVVVSSGLGKLGRPGYSAYAASKHAVLGMVKCLAPELADRGVRVNAVCPGWVDTEMAARDVVVTAAERSLGIAETRAAAEAGIPLRRFVRADEVAALVRFLVSDEASAVTGQSYNISCGEFTL